MELAVLAAVVLLVAGTSHASFCNANGVADSVNKYSDLDTFGSVVVKCPIELTWNTVGNAKTWFQAVLGKQLINITLVEGNGRQLQSKINYFVISVISNAPAGRTQQRVLSLSDFNYELITTFDSSTLPLFPWTTFVRLERVTFLEHRVNYTLITFAQQGSINVPQARQALVRDQVQSLFYRVFAPSLKETFDGCEHSPTSLKPT
eukprot:TRINITY_DN1624_c0_g1_i2.p3 TRINITY_DN1624_c0_g1~~TRINITY_DN1624_c0_g1_i2.p3  ORF type:complete len:205 (-),score=25.63 TRINITY_DN1624_c0_g1_i2:1899-2513(-)